MVRRLASCLLLVATTVASSATTARAEPLSASLRAPALRVEKYTLANGLDVVLHVDRRMPQVAVTVSYDVGTKDDPPAKGELAHLLEHLFFEGSTNVGRDNHRAYLGGAGAAGINAITTRDRTSYVQRVPRHQLALALWLESDRMGFLTPALEAKVLARERAVVKNERRQRSETQPNGFVHGLVLGALYPEGHPYRPAPPSAFDDIDRVTMADLVAFRRRFYGPANATLVLAGDIDVAATKALVARYFGTLPRGTARRTSRAPVPFSLTTETRLDIEADVEAAHVVFMWPTPRVLAPGDAELDLIAHVLAGGRGSRLARRLLDDASLAHLIRAQQVSGLLASQFELSIQLRKGVDVARVVAIVDEELERLGTRPPTGAELERARTRQMSTMVFGAEALADRANLFTVYNQIADDPAHFEKDLARYRAATPATVQGAAVSHLPRGRRVVAIVRPTPGAPVAGRLVRRDPP